MSPASPRDGDGTATFDLSANSRSRGHGGLWILCRLELLDQFRVLIGQCLVSLLLSHLSQPGMCLD